MLIKYKDSRASRQTKGLPAVRRGKMKKNQNNKGFTLVETLVGVFVFSLVLLAGYGAYVALFKVIQLNHQKITAINLANEQFELIRNIPYANVGVPGGIPNGVIPHSQTLVRSGITFDVLTTIRNIDLLADGTIGGTPNDTSPSDNKLVEVEVSCAVCTNFAPVILSTTVSPKYLEALGANEGAIFVKVFDANGVPVEGASVHIVNNKVSPAIVVNDVTPANGILQIIGVPVGSEAYEISVSKTGYSSARTYTSGDSSNPVPNQPHASVVAEQVTSISFAIDKLADLSIKTRTYNCVPIGSVNLLLKGTKTIGQDVLKYSQSIATDGSGDYFNGSVEWDFYNITGMDADYDVVGINPVNPVNVLPDADQEVVVTVAPKNTNSLLLTVKDSATSMALSGADIILTSTNGYYATTTTGRGYIRQTDWSLGAGQTDFINESKYFTNSGSVADNSPAGEIRLLESFGQYLVSGMIESSTIDTGAVSNFYSFVRLPVDQPVLAGEDSVKLQFATNSTTTQPISWDFVGPDGTSATYYTLADNSLSSVHNGDRYVRYRAFLSTEVATATPNVSDIAFTFTSECTPPGQVVFSGLADGDYTITVSKTGYTDVVRNVTISSPWREEEIILSP